MPYLDGFTITKAWRHRDEVDRIHYIVSVDGRPRHLVADKRRSGGMYELLELALEAKGYTGPKEKKKEHVG